MSVLLNAAFFRFENFAFDFVDEHIDGFHNAPLLCIDKSLIYLFSRTFALYVLFLLVTCAYSSEANSFDVISGTQQAGTDV